MIQVGKKKMKCCSSDRPNRISETVADQASGSGSNASAHQNGFQERCLSCDKTGRSVKRETIQQMLKPELIAQIGERNYSFCGDPECRVVYFADEEEDFTFTTADLRVRVGIKETSDPITICYCFGHTTASVREELSRTGQSTVVARISAEITAGNCACQMKNPSGRCCLAEVSKVVKALGRERASGISYCRPAQLGASD